MVLPPLSVRIGAYMNLIGVGILLISPLLPYVAYTPIIPPTDNFHPLFYTIEAIFGFVLWATLALGRSYTIYFALLLVIFLLSSSTVFVPLACSNAILRGKPRKVNLPTSLIFASLGLILSVLFDVFNFLSLQLSFQNDAHGSLAPGFWLPPLLFVLCISGSVLIAANDRFSIHARERQIADWAPAELPSLKTDRENN